MAGGNAALYTEQKGGGSRGGGHGQHSAHHPGNGGGGGGGGKGKGKGKGKKHKKPDWSNWNPVSPGPIPPRFQHLLNAFLNKQVGQYANPRQRAITGYTKSLAGELGDIAPNIGRAYNQAVGQSTGIETTLANRLTSAGQETAGGIQQALGAAGQDLAPALAQGQTAVGVGNASFAQGASSLQNLIAQGAAARAYGAQQPGIAALGGLQASKGLQAQAQSMIPDLTSQFMNNELQKYIARTNFGQSKAELKQRKRESKQSHQEFLASLNLDNQKFLADQLADQKDIKKDTAKTIDSSISSAISAAEKWKSSGGGGGTSGSPTSGAPTGGGGGVSAQQAYRRVLQRLHHDLRNQHISDAKIKRFARYVLSQAGYKTKGVGKKGKDYDLSWING